MNTLVKKIISPQATLVLILIFATAIGIATFVEQAYTTRLAKQLIYNARWMELLYLLLIVNFLGNIKRYKLWSKEKWPGLLFHCAFIVMLFGAAITRYTGYEGMMHIREGQSANQIYTSTPYLQISSADKSTNLEIPILPGNDNYNNFSKSVRGADGNDISISYKNHINNAVEKLNSNVANGEKIIEVQLYDNQTSQSFLIKDKGSFILGGFVFSFNNADIKHDVLLSDKDGIIEVKANVDVQFGKHNDEEFTTIPVASTFIYDSLYDYFLEGIGFKVLNNYQNAAITYAEGLQEGRDVIVLEFKAGNESIEVPVIGGSGYISQPKNVAIGKNTFSVYYGDKVIELPFSLHLKDFILERYSGSNSPSSFASEVVLIDPQKNINQDYRIFMNNVLDHRGYRFFQSSYDQDEKGTILSVSHDRAGTLVTYFGYFLLGLGFIFTLFNKNSRFIIVARKIKEISELRKSGALIIILLALSANGFSQQKFQKVDTEHADKFGHLISQTYGGRFEPIHSLAIDVMHKISRKDQFQFEGKGKMECIDVFMDMIIDSEYWKQQKMIYVREKSVRNIIGIDGKYASFNDFFTDEFEYKLTPFVSTAFRKQMGQQTRFDKEVIKVDERVNICFMVFNGSLLKIFPDNSSSNNNWVSWDERPAMTPLTGSVTVINQELGLDMFNYRSILKRYFDELSMAMSSGNYNNANKILGYINAIQRHSDYKNVVPSETKVNYEVYYNKANIFVQLKKWYSYLSLILLALAFAENLKKDKNKWITPTLKVFIGLLVLAFLYHTFGMGLRWYLSGHAPWSNGYETLILVAWGSLLAGFIFMKYSKITLAATTLLAFLTLMTAGHSSYDPQLTNLQPVLKSYWLIIHVAAMTISYSFLGLGFMLGLINLVVTIFKNNVNKSRLDPIIKEHTFINEMLLTIGLVLAVAGTFLGAVWANESWGRYWGWDAKETWALIIIMVYSLVLHLRLVPKLRSVYLFNVCTVLSFSTVLMTFIGVNYYLTKGMHSYAQGDTPVFPMWAWLVIFSIFGIITAAGIQEKKLKA